MGKNQVLDWIALVLVIIGGLNWGFSIFDFNLVTALFGSIPTLVKIIYALMGLAAAYMIYYAFK